MPSLVAPEVPKFDPTGLELFMKGFGMMALINRKRQQAELDMRTAVAEQALREQKFELDKARLSETTERAAERLDLSERRLSLDSQRQKFAEDKFRAEIDDIQGLMGELQHLKAKPGTPERNAKLAEIAAKHPYASRNSLGKSVIAKEWEDHEGAVKSKAKLFNDKLTKFGLPYDAFENPQEWIPRPDGKRYRDVVDSQGRASTVTINDSTFKNLNKEFQEIVGASAVAPSRQMEEADNKELDADTAKALLNEAGGDKAKARQLAVERGYKL